MVADASQQATETVQPVLLDGPREGDNQREGDTPREGDNPRYRDTPRKENNAREGDNLREEDNAREGDNPKEGDNQVDYPEVCSAISGSSGEKDPDDGGRDGSPNKSTAVESTTQIVLGGSQSPAAENVSGDGAQPETQKEPDSSPSKSKPFGPPTDLLVPLEQPLPDTWVTNEADYLGIIPIMITHLSRSSFGDANFEIGSGKIRLMWIDGSISRSGALKLFSGTDTGKHVDMAEVKVIDVRAFRIDPITPNGTITVDGEKVRYGPIQAQIHPHMATVMSRKRRT